GLRVPLDQSTSALSGGQKQRLALAGVLAMEPKLILLDEPTANLDPAGVTEVRDAVARTVAQSGATLIVIEHRVAVWRGVVVRACVLARAGGVRADGSPDAVLTKEGKALADAGVWVPEFPPATPKRDPWPASDVLLQGSALEVGRRRGVTVASGIDVTVASGRALAVSGRNGSGKSTLALTLAGLIRPHGGDVTALPALAAGVGSEPMRWKSRELLTRIGT